MLKKLGSALVTKKLELLSSLDYQSIKIQKHLCLNKVSIQKTDKIKDVFWGGASVVLYLSKIRYQLQVLRTTIFQQQPVEIQNELNNSLCQIQLLFVGSKGKLIPALLKRIPCSMNVCILNGSRHVVVVVQSCVNNSMSRGVRLVAPFGERHSSIH